MMAKLRMTDIKHMILPGSYLLFAFKESNAESSVWFESNPLRIIIKKTKLTKLTAQKKLHKKNTLR